MKTNKPLIYIVGSDVLFRDLLTMRLKNDYKVIIHIDDESLFNNLYLNPAVIVLDCGTPPTKGAQNYSWTMTLQMIMEFKRGTEVILATGAVQKGVYQMASKMDNVQAAMIGPGVFSMIKNQITDRLILNGTL